MSRFELRQPTEKLGAQLGRLHSVEQQALQDVRQDITRSLPEQRHLLALMSLFALTTAACERFETTPEQPPQESRQEVLRRQRVNDFGEALIQLEQAGHKFEFNGATISVAQLSNWETQHMAQVSWTDADILSAEEIQQSEELSALIKLLQPYPEASRNPSLQVGFEDPWDWQSTHPNASTIPAHHISLVVDPAGPIHITVENWLSNRVIYEADLPSTEESLEEIASAAITEDGPATVVLAGVEALEKDSQHLSEEMAIIRDAYFKKHPELSAETRSNYTILERLPGDGIERLHDLAADGWAIDLCILPMNSEVDVLIGEGTISSLGLDTLHQYDSGTFAISGTVHVIALNKLIDNLSVQELSSAAHPSKIVVDKYNNYMVVKKTETLDQKLLMTISVNVPISLTSNDQQAPFTPISVDLTEFGGPDLPNVLVHESHHAQFTLEQGTSKYSIFSLNRKFMDGYSNFENKSKIDARLKRYASGAQQLERDFAVPEGSLVQSIVIADTLDLNAAFRPVTPGALWITDTLVKSDTFNVLPIGYHETAHAMTNKLGLVDGPLLKESFKKSSRDFFEMITEVNWDESINTYMIEQGLLNNLAMGGHPEDNLTETISSFLNTLRDVKPSDAGGQTWRFYGKPKTAVRDYIRFGEALKKTLLEPAALEKLGLPKDTNTFPIIEKIDYMVDAARQSQTF